MKGVQVIKISIVMTRNDSYLFARPISTYINKGKTYILDGHHRVKAAILNNQAINVIELNATQAMRMYKVKFKKLKEDYSNGRFFKRNFNGLCQFYKWI